MARVRPEIQYERENPRLNVGRSSDWFFPVRFGFANSAAEDLLDARLAVSPNPMSQMPDEPQSTKTRDSCHSGDEIGSIIEPGTSISPVKFRVTWFGATVGYRVLRRAA